VGLLYDLFSGANPASSNLQRRDRAIQDDDVGEDKLPWKLALHFTEWPEEQLVKLDGQGKFLHDAFINSVKEADFIRNGTAKGIMSLSKDDSTQLWKAVEDRKYSNAITVFGSGSTSQQTTFLPSIISTKSSFTPKEQASVMSLLGSTYLPLPL